jgi:excisionase family DNA binding protein
MPEQIQQHPSGIDGALLNADDVARILGVPKTWVYAETRAGRLPHVNVGRYRRYRRSTIDAWIADRECGPVSRRQAPTTVSELRSSVNTTGVS